VVSFSKAIKLTFRKAGLRTIAAILTPVSGTAAILDRSPRNLIAMEF
jgi:hypothetical protein